MHNEYKDLEKRKLYLKNWRKKNREKIYKYHREYYKKNKDKFNGYYKKNREHYKYKCKCRCKQKNLSGTSGIGRKYEKLALKLLDGAMDCNKYNSHGKYDIIWNSYKIDVKMRSIRNNGWSFRTRKNPTADYYLLFCVKDKIINKILFVPANVFKLGIGFGSVSKYDKYKIVLSK